MRPGSSRDEHYLNLFITLEPTYQVAHLARHAHNLHSRGWTPETIKNVDGGEHRVENSCPPRNGQARHFQQNLLDIKH